MKDLERKDEDGGFNREIFEDLVDELDLVKQKLIELYKDYGELKIFAHREIRAIIENTTSCLTGYETRIERLEKLINTNKNEHEHNDGIARKREG